MLPPSRQLPSAGRAGDELSRPAPSFLSAAQLIDRACASLDFGSRLLAEGAAGLATSSSMILEGTTSKLTQQRTSTVSLRRSLPTSAVYLDGQSNSEAAPKPKENPRKGPTTSPFFPIPTKQKSKQQLTKSPFFPEPFSRDRTPFGLSFPLEPSGFGLIQERICGDLFALVVQAILWNKTRGAVARPILWDLLCKYPNPVALAEASAAEVEKIIGTLGLQRQRARRLVDMAKVWLAAPPCSRRRYGRRNYPKPGSNRLVKEGELLGPDDEREGWEIAHLPGVGEYALDSYRIFGRDRLRGVHDDYSVEPEWKRVVPRDKELGPYCRWKWAQEGWNYNITTGIRTRTKP